MATRPGTHKVYLWSSLSANGAYYSLTFCMLSETLCLTADTTLCLFLPALPCYLSHYPTTSSHPSSSVTHHINDASTTNLNKHVAKCAPEESVTAVKMTKWAAGSTYSRQKFRVGLVEWVVAKCRPFSIVEDEQLHMLFTMLDPKVEMPSRHSVQRDILHLYAITRACLVKMLQVSCRFSFSGHLQFFTIGTYWRCACWA